MLPRDAACRAACRRDDVAPACTRRAADQQPGIDAACFTRRRRGAPMFVSVALPLIYGGAPMPMLPASTRRTCRHQLRRARYNAASIIAFEAA